MSLGDPRIPDLWYDYYARLLPGTAFLAGFYWLVLDRWPGPGFSDTALFLGAGYMVGLAVQPFGSGIAYYIEKKKDREDKVDKAKEQLGRDKRPALVLSKMHAEIAFFSQCLVLGVILLLFYIATLLQAIFLPISPAWSHALVIIVLVILVFYCYWAAGNFAHRQLKKAEKYTEKEEIEKNVEARGASEK